MSRNKDTQSSHCPICKLPKNIESNYCPDCGYSFANSDSSLFSIAHLLSDQSGICAPCDPTDGCRCDCFHCKQNPYETYTTNIDVPKKESEPIRVPTPPPTPNSQWPFICRFVGRTCDAIEDCIIKTVISSIIVAAIFYFLIKAGVLRPPF